MKVLLASYDKVIVKELKPEKVTKGGLVLPDTSSSMMLRGEVVNCGVCTEDFMDVQKQIDSNVRVFGTGDIVYYLKHNGYEIEVEGESFTVLDLKDIKAKELEVNPPTETKD